MPRYRQVVKEDGSSTFVEIGAPERRASTHAVHGDIESFRSPIDGSVISDRKQYREHMEKHGVVPSAEFSPEYYQRKAEERAKFYDKSRLSKEEKWARKAEINEAIERAIRNGS